MEGSLLRLGEELAKTFRPKLRTHAAAAPAARARDSALPPAWLAAVRPYTRTDTDPDPHIHFFYSNYSSVGLVYS